MTTIKDICNIIENFAPLALQEDYDNAGLLIGNPDATATAALLCIDVTEKIVDEAIEKRCNIIISHHPLIFKGLKSITGKNEIEKCVVKAIKNDIAIYAAHTNLDNLANGVNGKIAEKIGLKNCQILQPKIDVLLKLVTFVPVEQADNVRKAIFEAGAGHIGNYDSCSYNLQGEGTFKASEAAKPFVGNIGELHTELEIRIETILPVYLKNKVLTALIKAHPYEEPAFDIYELKNVAPNIGSGLKGELEQSEDELAFLNRLKAVFNIPSIRHSPFTGKKIKKVALCGGAGSFLINKAIASQADVFITGDLKYHDFFLPENKLLMADIGHFESEQYTKEIFFEIIRKKIPTFATHFSEVNTNPINYL
jgi:dinuclear metal center YbgI/SA1388 family protein